METGDVLYFNVYFRVAETNYERLNFGALVFHPLSPCQVEQG